MSAITGTQTQRTEAEMVEGVRTSPALRWNNWINALIAASLGFAAVVLVFYLVTALDWRSEPFAGAIFSEDMTVLDVQPFSDERWSALDIGVEPDDVLIGIDQVVWAENERHERFLETMAELPTGKSIELRLRTTEKRPDTLLRCFDAPGGYQRCFIHILPTENFALADFAFHFGVGYVTGVLIWLVGLAVLWRRSETRAAKMFAVSTAALSIVVAGRFDLMTTFNLVPVWVVASYLFASILVSFAVSFPYDITVVRRAPSLRYSPLLGGMILAGLNIWAYQQQKEILWLLLPLIAIFVGAASLIVVMAWRREYSRSPILREQATFVGAGATAAFLPLLVWAAYLGVTRGAILNELTPVAQVSIILYVLSTAYAILQYRLLETDRIIPEFTVYLVLTGLLILGYLLLTLGLSRLAVGALAADSPVVIALTVGVIVLLFNPARSYLRDSIDRLMFRKRRSYQQRSEAFSRSLTDAVNMGDILAAIKQELKETVSPSHVFLFVYDSRTQDYVALPAAGEDRPETDITFPHDGGLVKYLSEEQAALYLETGEPLPLTLVSDRSRLAVLGTPLFLRIQGRDRLQGILAVGARRSGEAYTYEDLRYIENLVDLSALAVQRAQFVNDLERRVRIQDVLSQVSQALNFAIDFDTLLELIYAQTSRIIDADHFYIVSFEPETQRLHYSFYNMGDERLYYMEKVQWSIGKDVISEVIKKQIPMRLNRFTQEQLRRDPNFKMGIGLPEIHAWIGVPLVTDTAERGSNVLGVMAMGSSTPDLTFTDEQLQLLRDIANIAASAIDKTRLFQKTELRAAQLKALNDIASEMASQLEDVNRLLERIIESAVRILGCEAGSLLLVDEITKDIVFRVVTGGGGQELIGKRIPRDQPSLVADAVNRVETVIVNDPSHDARWHGEVASDDGDGGQKTAFASRAILTVPLVAQGVAVGALQVINKLDGSPFTEEDAVLATTFAGQAAIAIQNARLFESQDQQLLARVQELEGMAEIDHSLNQTLILNELVDIIMRWALRQTGASNGVIFLLNDDRETMRLIASYGYPEEGSLFSPSKVNTNFPRNTGILGRVIRSRTPSIVVEVNNDPDYVESLPGCKAQIAVPIVRGTQVTGAALVETVQEGILDVLDMGFMTRLMERASSAIANALLYSQLEQQQRARAEFVSFIAHELKNPLTAMKGYTSLLVRGVVGELSPQQAQFLTTVHTNIDHMEHLVNDIRDMELLDAKGQLAMQMSEVSFPDVLRDSLQTVKQAFDAKQQTVILHVPDDLPEIWADATRLNQTMINFLTNANKYTDEGGKIEIRAEAVDNQWDDKGAARVLHVSINDNGLGISEEDMKHLFEKYFRSTNDRALAQKGTGLGLTLTKRLIEQQGGKIWVESQLNVGTTFHFTIPLASEVMRERV